MHPLALKKRLIRFALTNVVLFTLAFSLTIIPSTFASLPQTNSPAEFHTQTTLPSTTTPQQLVSQGEALYQSGRFTEAVTVLQQAIRIYQLEGDNLAQAAALTNLSRVFSQLGSWKEASLAINTSLNLLGWDNTNQKLNVNNPKSELLEVLAQTLEIQSGLQLSLGQADVSLKTSQLSEQIWKRCCKQDSAGVTRSRINSAQALRVSGFYRRSLDILNTVSHQLQTQPDSLEKVTALRSLGIVQQQIGDLEQSKENLQQSLKIAQRLQLPLEISLTELSLGNTARVNGNIKDAIAHYENAASVASNPLTKVQAQINQLSLLVENKNTTDVFRRDATSLLISTIQSELATLPTTQAGIYARINLARTINKIGDKRNTAEILATSVQQAQDIGDERAQSYALGSLAEVYEQNNQWLSAQKLTQQALFLAQKIEASDIAYRWEWQLGRLLKAQGNIKGAIAAYTQAVDTLQSLRSDLVAVNPDAQFSFRESVEPVYRELVELHLRQTGSSQPSQEDLKLARKTIELLQLAELENFFRSACLNAKVDIDKVVDHNNSTAAVFYAIILDQRLEVIVKLPNQQELRHYTQTIAEDKVESTVASLQEYLLDVSRTSDVKQQSQQLYDWLIRPAAPELTKSGIKTLVFVLDGVLRNIPMAVLFDAQQQKYLVEQYALALTPSLQLVNPKPWQRVQLNALTAGVGEKRSVEGREFGRLENVANELQRIQSVVAKTKELLNQKFTSANLQNQLQSAPFSVVHLATHGEFSSNPENTFILTWDQLLKVKDFDNLLRVSDSNRSSSIELLVLSACQTAQGDKRAALGLAGVAVRAGARSTLATLWSVDDKSTTEFMSQFYRELKNGVTKASALQHAQLAVLNHDDRPYFWAPYVLVGNWL